MLRRGRAPAPRQAGSASVLSHPRGNRDNRPIESGLECFFSGRMSRSPSLFLKSEFPRFPRCPHRPLPSSTR
ncbi:hypothetical protein ALSL_0128 [Aerosticca soli]|uniref:Uncharacterized protein n=1 Tax=Aerosticca soli TaxID=2010829 RepID=A0A2Z6E1F9_9GAMM|nr:hypothetical protein ALSL_0128 [Aerosticca soli]